MDPPFTEPQGVCSPHCPAAHGQGLNYGFLSVIMSSWRNHTFDDRNPAWPSTYFTTTVPTVLVQEVMQDFHHQ